ncbi:hypothetical protein JOE59_002816 [Agromyces cerinus]|uniref:hypothetical protein n=1 Tax=Agromyces cerinus TaxID=33878 RepID=UPI00195DDD10|nr:hypothetical protein [Agromyces cerinus]MBM7832111.1 hypothetical protein [Agromyces cerinus]
MSEGATSGIDPRFDPRYQRGYAGGEEITTDAAAAVPAARLRVPDPPAPAPIATSDAGRPSSGGGRPAPATPVSAVDSGPRAERVVERARNEVDHEEQARDAFVVEAVSSGRSAIGWLIAGWTVTLAAFAAGAYLSWMVNSDIGYYTGTVSSGDQWLRDLGWTLSPSLIMAGATGVVVVTALAAFLHLRGAVEASDDAEGRLGRGTAWWALVSIGALGVVGVAWAVGRASEASFANAGLVFDGNGNPTGEQADVFAQIALGQFAQTLVGPLALAAIAAFVALVAVEVRRATISSELERSARPDRP